MVGLSTHTDHGWLVSSVAGWDAGLAVLLTLMWRTIVRADADRTRQRAEAVDPGRRALFAITITASLVSLVVAVPLLRDPGAFEEPNRIGLLIALSAAAVVGAWILVHTAFTLHYAHLYYRDDGTPGGLDFPGTEFPDDLDFAYFSFIIGMTFQTADVGISDRALRRTALSHGLIAFVFNTAVLALAISLVFGRLG